ncbi:hypothetical protein [Bartonella sp. DGB2]|uniref:hypothetical protein n=1 Tax=Bartonella sp. DGB2 TaxID=3388426 RepID=UPI0039901CA3
MRKIYVPIMGRIYYPISVKGGKAPLKWLKYINFNGFWQIRGDLFIAKWLLKSHGFEAFLMISCLCVLMWSGQTLFSEHRVWRTRFNSFVML